MSQGLGSMGRASGTKAPPQLFQADLSETKDRLEIAGSDLGTRVLSTAYLNVLFVRLGAHRVHGISTAEECREHPPKLSIRRYRGHIIGNLQVSGALEVLPPRLGSTLLGDRSIPGSVLFSTASNVVCNNGVNVPFAAMNTIRSTWLGWGALCVAGGGAYYFAKQSINADRTARHEAEMKKQNLLRRMESYEPPSPSSASKSKASKKSSDSGSNNHKGLDHAGDPSSEASEDAAAVGHAPATAEQKLKERSKYEAAEPYRSKKGDRFS